MNKIVRNIPLWGIFYEKYGKEIRGDNFWIDLERITGMERLDSKNNAEYIRKAYNDDARYLIIVETSETPVKDKDQKARVDEVVDKDDTMESMQVTQVAPGIIGYIGFPEYSKAPIEIRDEASLNVAKLFLVAIEEKVKQLKQANNQSGSSNIE